MRVFILIAIDVPHLPGWLFLLVALSFFLIDRRRRFQERWEAYIHEECALYLEEVLLAAEHEPTAACRLR
jgi:hypothetical protein